MKLELNQDILQLDELPKNPDKQKDENKQEHRERIEAHNHMVAESKKVYEELGDSAFYLTHSYCKRGRMHTNGYHTTNQGSEYKKALIQLKTKHLITGV